MLDSAHAASFCTLGFECLISWGRTFRTPASTAACVCRSDPLTMFPMERRAGVCRSDRSQITSLKSLRPLFLDLSYLPWHWAPRGSWAPPAEGLCQFSLQHQCGHCHHQRGRRLPSMHQTRCPYHWGGVAGSVREAPEGTTAHYGTFQLRYCWKSIIELWCYIPAGPQTTEDTGSYFDTSWTMSMSDYAGSQPEVITHYDQQDYTAANSWGKVQEYSRFYTVKEMSKILSFSKDMGLPPLPQIVMTCL